MFSEKSQIFLEKLVKTGFQKKVNSKRRNLEKLCEKNVELLSNLSIFLFLGTI